MVSRVTNNTHLTISSVRSADKGTSQNVNETKETEKTKAQDIKERIQNGTYKIDLQKTAEEMASYLLR